MGSHSHLANMTKEANHMKSKYYWGMMSCVGSVGILYRYMEQICKSQYYKKEKAFIKVEIIID